MPNMVMDRNKHRLWEFIIPILHPQQQRQLYIHLHRPLKTYNEVIDEIYYSVRHLEPWEKGSRKVTNFIFL
ncbi:hypothetical protein BLA29_007385 [Euroglyphus maynei]|uniref:Uncharacterized protein n=1 Tax=Euroglyphus maynei TaxID=6958 RepID=A0A1Y3AZI0_EURMA|nr:hypothetical protein BLA29_007385 [Euroglyphus maynei]